MTCRGCGGVLGRDCWNEEDCMWITQDMQRRVEIRRDDVDECDMYGHRPYDASRGLSLCWCGSVFNFMDSIGI